MPPLPTRAHTLRAKVATFLARVFGFCAVLAGAGALFVAAISSSDRVGALVLGLPFLALGIAFIFAKPLTAEALVDLESGGDGGSSALSRLQKWRARLTKRWSRP